MNDLSTEDCVEDVAAAEQGQAPRHEQPTMSGETSTVMINGIVIGMLVAFKDEGRTPLVIYTGQPGSAALPARTIMDIHGSHIGRQVVLMFDQGDPRRPIVMGSLRSQEGWPLERPGQVEIDADGERMIVSAKEQLVLRCGKASITLTRTGKILIDGAYVSSRSSGVNRIKGGSVQLN